MGQLGEDRDRPEWKEVEAPFGITLFDVAQTSQGLYAVGSGANLVADRDHGWGDTPRRRSEHAEGTLGVNSLTSHLRPQRHPGRR